MTHPRAAKGRFIRRGPHRCRRMSSSVSGASCLPVRLTAAATRQRQLLNGRPTSILTPLLGYIITDGDVDVLAVLARRTAGRLAPAAVEQDVGGLNACAGRRVGGRYA